MKSLLRKFHAWRAAQKHKKAVRLIQWLAKNEPVALTEFIQNRAGELSLQVTMGFLERDGLLHCYVCPQRFGLMNVGPYKACGRHLKEVQAKVKADQAPMAGVKEPEPRTLQAEEPRKPIPLAVAS